MLKWADVLPLRPVRPVAIDEEIAMHATLTRSLNRCARWGATASMALVAAALAGCAVGGGIGVGIPVGPVSIGVGLGSGGLSAGVGTGVGPLGVGVGVNQRGQVTGSAGVGVSTGIGGGAHVGAGVGTSTVLHDPAHSAPVAEPDGTPAAAPPSAGTAPDAIQWRDASGQPVPPCRVEGRC